MNRRALLLAAIATLVAGIDPAEAQRRRRSSSARPRRARSTRSTRASAGSFGGAGASYSSCAEARAAGAAPMRVGDPGYSTRLDRDRDGVACE